AFSRISVASSARWDLGRNVLIASSVNNVRQIEKQAYEELYKMYGSSDTKDVPIKYQVIKHMRFLDRVIKETLRLFPPTPFVGRTLSKGTDFSLTFSTETASSI
ncbi:hypothetical protein M0804_011938, partial [Polistes exclamans]